MLLLIIGRMPWRTRAVMGLLFFLQQQGLCFGSSVSEYTCEVRYELASALRQERDCQQWIELNPACKDDIEVSFSETPPYIYMKDGEISGVLPGLFSAIFLSSPLGGYCCLSCVLDPIIPSF